MQSLYLILRTYASVLATIVVGTHPVLALVLPMEIHRGLRLLVILLLMPTAVIVPLFSKVICLLVLPLAVVVQLGKWR